MSNYKNKYKVKKAKCKELKATIKALMLENNNLMATNELAKANLANKDFSIITLQDENECLKKDLSIMEQRYKDLQTEFTKYKVQVGFLGFDESTKVANKKSQKKKIDKSPKLGDDDGTPIGEIISPTSE